MHFITEYAFGVHGFVVRWELYSGSARRVQLQAWRCMGEYQYELVGEISAQIDAGYNVVNVDPDSHMLVQSGDVVGWYMPDRQTIPFNEEGRHLLVRRVSGRDGVERRLDMSGHELGWC